MKSFTPLLLSAIALSVFAACSSTPVRNADLEAARGDLASAQANPQVVSLAPAELRQAADALKVADDAWIQHTDAGEVSHLAYLARQRTSIAQESTRQKLAETAVTNATVERDRIRLAARTREADAAQEKAQTAEQKALAAQRDTAAAQQNSLQARQESVDARQQTRDAEMQAEESARQNQAAQGRNAQLEAQLDELNAHKTSRGLVITIGDVLFDTNKADLKSGGLHSMEKLAGFFKQYPQRTALVEGYTDSTGSAGTNLTLSDRRANAVRSALVGMGVSGDRIATKGYGESFPVAGNDNAADRQLNRRVEVILSDDDGHVIPR